MNSKTILYFSYSMPFIAMIPLVIFKINILFFMIPAVAVSYLLKRWALKKATLENREPDYMEAIKKELKTGVRAFIGLLCIAGIYAIYMYS